jgi:hypothetical protein
MKILYAFLLHKSTLFVNSIEQGDMKYAQKRALLVEAFGGRRSKKLAKASKGDI